MVPKTMCYNAGYLKSMRDRSTPKQCKPIPQTRAGATLLNLRPRPIGRRQSHILCCPMTFHQELMWQLSGEEFLAAQYATGWRGRGLLRLCLSARGWHLKLAGAMAALSQLALPNPILVLLRAWGTRRHERF